MGDLLIRNLDDALKHELQNRARENGRSLSEEAIIHLRRSLSTLREDRQPAGEWLRGLLGAERWTDDELSAIETARHEADRAPPKFHE
ncbi:FitA-like ribbon-helix-helix domain-containing protein [Hyphomicrobiales bacterium]|jgi:plasmid stability protein|uniref:FitA-like ribbon-helix-helix domain-containing protein n=1 Tax=unclassified Rhizobium TaxID=2613769 RepID=UPI000DE043D0